MTSNRPIAVLHVTPAYYPATGWGGPIFSTLAICDGLARCPGVTVSVLTTDAAGPSLAERLDVARQVTFPTGYTVFYARRIAGRDMSIDLLTRLVPMMRAADIVHLTATYSFPTLPTLAIAKALGKPLMWSPRGALQARREWTEADSAKKAAFERICRALAPVRTVLHVTSEAEAKFSREAIPRKTVIIPNAINGPSDCALRRPFRPKGQLRILFLSRIHPKKGIETLFTALAGLPSSVTLDVYGSGAAEYIDDLKARAAALGISGRVLFHGHVDGAAKTAAFRAADIFVLPSYSENFGIAVAEALAHGVPVVTTTITPWAETVAYGCGLQFPAGDAAELIRAVARLGDSDLAAMGRRGRSLIAARYSADVVVERMRDAYLALLGSH